MNSAYIKYTKVHWISQISADLEYLEPLQSICFHLEANLPKGAQKKVPKYIAAALSLTSGHSFKQYVDISHDMCKSFINSVSC